jgi:hypothetical protein
MSEKSITLQLPDELYVLVQEAADASERPMEEVLLESIEILFKKPIEPLDKLLASLPHYSIAQLWAVVYRQLP